MRLADYVVERLFAEGITTVYQVTGRGSLFLSDALARRKDINSVSTHHEQAAGYAAVAESSLTGLPAACFVSTGCAATNLVSAVLSAWQDQLPVIFVSGQNHLKETSRGTGLQIRTFGEQETDIVKIVESITKFSVMLDSPDTACSVLEQAISAAKRGRPGPIWIDIPLDLQSASVTPANGQCELDVYVEGPESNLLAYFAEKVGAASRPILLLGVGSTTPKARELVLSVSSNLNLPIVYESSAVDVVPWSNRLVVGSVGAMGCSRAGNFALQNSDFVIVVGSALKSSLTGEDPSLFARNAFVVHVDVDNSQLRPNGPRVDLNISMSPAEFLSFCLSMPARSDRDHWIEKCEYWKHYFLRSEQFASNETSVDLYDLSAVIGSALPDNAVLVTDSGLIELIVPTNTRFSDGQRCVHPFSQGAMGFALPASIGAAFCQEHPVAVVVGDGSIMMNIQELQTIFHHRLNIKIFVVNNGEYAIIRRRQEELFRGRTIGTDSSNGVSCPDFKAVAEAFELSYTRLHARGLLDLERSIRDVMSRPGPILIELDGKRDQDYTRVGRRRLSGGKSVICPIEDQMPFLSRTEFHKLMIVPTVNTD